MNSIAQIWVGNLEGIIIIHPLIRCVPQIDSGPRRPAVVATGTGSGAIRHDIATPPRAKVMELGFRPAVRSASASQQ